MTRFVDSASASHPDGGCLAWTIVAASFMVSFLQDVLSDSFVSAAISILAEQKLLLPTLS